MTNFRFLSAQPKIDQLRCLMEAANHNDDYVQADLYFQQIQSLKQLQKDHIQENWIWFIELWFTESNIKKRLDLALEYGILEINTDNANNLKFTNENHYVRAAITRAKELRFWTYWRDNSICVHCGIELTKKNSQIDHLIPISAWPAEFIFLAEDITNLAPSCKTCNLKKRNFVKLPDIDVLHVEIDSCLPKRQLLDETCSNLNLEHRETCDLFVIDVYCSIHGLQKMQLCQLTALKKYFGHDN